MKKIYLAIPYTGYEELSFELANLIAGELILQGHIVYSPISQSHPIVKTAERFNPNTSLKGNWPVWEKIDLAFIDWADEVMVINFAQTAVQQSTGVQAEIKYALEHHKPVSYYY